MIGFLKTQDCSVEISPSGVSLRVPAGQTLLQAALDAGVDFPHNCRVGSCTTCKCRLVSGKIKELSDTAYVLDESDIARGVILACQTLLKSDAVIEVELES